MKTKVCKYCGVEFLPKPKANNVKFCSKSCRTKYYYHNNNMKEYQRERARTKLEEKYSRDELIQCKICGKFFRQVGSHIYLSHGLTAREYRKEFGFDVKKGQLPKDYRQLKSKQAFECGGVRNLKLGAVFRFEKGQKGVGVYKRSPQTKERLKQQGKKFAKNLKYNH